MPSSRCARMLSDSSASGMAKAQRAPGHRVLGRGWPRRGVLLIRTPRDTQSAPLSRRRHRKQARPRSLSSNGHDSQSSCLPVSHHGMQDERLSPLALSGPSTRRQGVALSRREPRVDPQSSMPISSYGGYVLRIYLCAKLRRWNWTTRLAWLDLNIVTCGPLRYQDVPCSCSYIMSHGARSPSE